MSTHATSSTLPSAKVDMADFEPDKKWKHQMRKRIEEGMESMVKDARDILAAELRTSPKDDRRLQDEYKQATSNIRTVANEQYQFELNRERNQRRWTAGFPVHPDWSRILREEQQNIMNSIKQSNHEEPTIETSTDQRNPILQAKPGDGYVARSRLRAIYKLWRPSIPGKESAPSKPTLVDKTARPADDQPDPQSAYARPSLPDGWGGTDSRGGWSANDGWGDWGDDDDQGSWGASDAAAADGWGATISRHARPTKDSWDVTDNRGGWGANVGADAGWGATVSRHAWPTRDSWAVTDNQGHWGANSQGGWGSDDGRDSWGANNSATDDWNAVDWISWGTNDGWGAPGRSSGSIRSVSGGVTRLTPQAATEARKPITPEDPSKPYTGLGRRSSMASIRSTGPGGNNQKERKSIDKPREWEKHNGRRDDRPISAAKELHERWIPSALPAPPMDSGRRFETARTVGEIRREEELVTRKNPSEVRNREAQKQETLHVLEEETKKEQEIRERKAALQLREEELREKEEAKRKEGKAGRKKEKIKLKEAEDRRKEELASEEGEVKRRAAEPEVIFHKREDDIRHRAEERRPQDRTGDEGSWATVIAPPAMSSSPAQPTSTSDRLSENSSWTTSSSPSSSGMKPSTVSSSTTLSSTWSMHSRVPSQSGEARLNQTRLEDEIKKKEIQERERELALQLREEELRNVEKEHLNQEMLGEELKEREQEIQEREQELIERELRVLQEVRLKKESLRVWEEENKTKSKEIQERESALRLREQELKKFQEVRLNQERLERDIQERERSLHLREQELQKAEQLCPDQEKLEEETKKRDQEIQERQHALHLREQELKKREENRLKQETLQRSEEERKKKGQEIQEREQALRLREQELRKREEASWKKVEEAKRTEAEIRRKEREARNKEAEAKRKDVESKQEVQARRKDEAVRQEQEELEKQVFDPDALFDSKPTERLQRQTQSSRNREEYNRRTEGQKGQDNARSASTAPSTSPTGTVSTSKSPQLMFSWPDSDRVSISSTWTSSSAWSSSTAATIIPSRTAGRTFTSAIPPPLKRRIG